MSADRWQERRVLIAVVVMAVLAGAWAVVAAFKVTGPWVIGAAVVGVAVVGVLSGLVRDWYKRLAVRRDENTLKVLDGCLVLPGGRLPKVAQIDEWWSR